MIRDRADLHRKVAQRDSEPLSDEDREHRVDREQRREQLDKEKTERR